MCDGRLYATRSRNRTRGPGLAATLCALITLASCGGGSGNTTDSPPPAPAPTPVAASDAARLLEQATFGATASDVAHVQSIGIEAYIGEQLAYAPTQYTGFTYTPHTAPASCKNDGSNPPDAALANTPDSGGECRSCTMVAVTPNAAAERRMAPALCGSVIWSRTRTMRRFSFAHSGWM